MFGKPTYMDRITAVKAEIQAIRDGIHADISYHVEKIDQLNDAADALSFLDQ